jgi:hypothetical protein
MRTLLFIASLLPVMAQQATPPAVPTTIAPTAPAPASQQTPPVAPPATTPAPAEVKTDTPSTTQSTEAPPSPVPAESSWISGSIDVGYRWNAGVGGSLTSYRDIVNLGSGPKLLGADLTITDLKQHFFDVIHVRASDWGGDPYSTVHVDARKAKRYDFNADYRDIAYFSFSPSFADPLLANGIVLNQQSFDTHRRLGSFWLDLLPGNWFIPYVGYESDSGSGNGVTTFVSNGNSYPVPNQMNDQTHLYRGGIRFELKRFHATLEQGGTTFRDDQSLYQPSSTTPGSINYGDVLTPVIGQTLDLTGLQAAYGIRGTSIYSKGLFTANPVSWLDLYGQFLYSQPESTVNYQEAATGNLYLQSQVLFYSSEQFLLSAASKMPHTTASFGAEMRPLRRVRITESWLTDRLHNAGSAESNQLVSGTGISQQTAALLASSLATNYNQAEIDVLFDANSKLTLRGGYRYMWGDANDAILPPADLVSSDQGKQRSNIGLGAVTYRPIQKLSLTGEVESGSSGGVYFRTSLYDYQKARAQARYQATKSLSLAADFTILDNHDPLPGVNFNYLVRQESLSILWSPAGGKRWDIEATYSRSDLRSEIGYLEPETLTADTSLYHDNSHIATGLFNLNLPRRLAPKSARMAPKLTAGGSFFISSGSNPSNYYQPIARLLLPLGKNVNWFTEWRYYGYGEAFYLYEGFRAHLVTTGLRFTR